MNLQEIKTAVDAGKSVHWSNDSYDVIKDKYGHYFINCSLNDNTIGLTWQDGTTLNGKESEFYLEEPAVDTYTPQQLETFVLHYVNSLLWSTPQSDDEGNCLGNLDDDYGLEDINADTYKEIVSDCKDFLELCLSEGFDFRRNKEMLEQSAHDYALTRNGHGAGYWDRSEDTYPGMDLNKLSELAKTQGSADLYVGDNGELYL
jgi:hypothetical protein